MKSIDNQPILELLRTRESLTRDELLTYFTHQTPGVSQSTGQWRIHRLEQRGLLHQTSNGTYRLGPSAFQSVELSPRSLRLASTLAKEAPRIITSIWEHSWLNYYSSLQSTKNIIHLDVERGFEEFVFNLLKSKGYANLLLKPTLDHFDWYSGATPIPIRIQTFTSRGPTKKYPHNAAVRLARIEKIAVDLVADPFLNAFTGCAPELARQMIHEPGINQTKLATYARRRGIDWNLDP